MKETDIITVLDFQTILEYLMALVNLYLIPHKNHYNHLNKSINRNLFLKSQLLIVLRSSILVLLNFKFLTHSKIANLYCSNQPIHLILYLSLNHLKLFLNILKVLLYFPSLISLHQRLFFFVPRSQSFLFQSRLLTLQSKSLVFLLP